MALKMLLVAATASAATSGNMNGKYSVASADRQDVPFNDDYASKGHEYFDVWAPEIATTYGENFWTSQGDTPLPDHIIKRFAGKIMAITGYEQDQVMVDPVGHPGVNPERDVSVPINWAYNHHYMAWMTGEHAQMVEKETDPNDVSAHGAPTTWVAVDRPSAATRANTVAPTSQMFSEGNGGESRKSFHGYPNGFAQLIDSPKTWRITPMQIDTRRRDCGVTRDSVHNCTKFEPWLEPRQARYGRPAGADSNYSGILECPCNSRFGGDPIFYPDAGTKHTEHTISTIPSGVCRAGQLFSKQEDCFSAARTLGIDLSALTNVSVSNASLPSGCLLVRHAGGKVGATFNSATSKAACPASQLRQGTTTSALNVTLGLSLDATKSGGEATLTLSGPALGWFGVGLNARLMSDSPYTLITNASGTFEQKIGTCGSEAQHCPGDRLASSLTLVSNTVADGLRTVVVKRAFSGLTKDHYSFDPTKLNTLPFITAVGYDQTFAYHKAHHAATLALLSPEGLATCLCDEGTTHSLCNTNRKSCQSWSKNCLGPWDGQPLHTGADLFTQKNPTCNSGQYAGGLRCCGHKRVMLDVDQDPGPDLLRYHMKFRFWFQEYDAGPSFHGSYVSRAGALPSGYDALPAATTTVSAALATCKASKVCKGITFASEDQMAYNQSVEVYFKNGTTYVQSNAAWHSWVEKSSPSHYDLPRYYYTTEAYAGEYDIPPAFRRHTDPQIPGYAPWPASSKGDMHPTPGTTCTGDCPDGPECECVHTITYHWTMSHARMLYAGGHCHAPSCISIELYRNDTGTPELVCRQASKYGQGDVAKDRFDEAGYVVLPPCLWGSKEEGLELPTWLPYGTPMYSIKRNRNTHAGHLGEMASWQMRGVPFPASETFITI